MQFIYQLKRNFIPTICKGTAGEDSYRYGLLVGVGSAPGVVKVPFGSVKSRDSSVFIKRSDPVPSNF